MLWVERDLSAIVKAVFDHWDTRKSQLMHHYLYAMGAVHTPTEVCAAIEKSESARIPPKASRLSKGKKTNWAGKVTGLPTKYIVLPTTGNESRDIMFNLYNKTGTYPGVKLPDPNVLDLGVKLHGLEEFIPERLVPHLQLEEGSIRD
jgi:hypothetical protein